MPSGVTGTCRPSSIFSASSRAVISSRPLPVTIRRSTRRERARGVGEARAVLERVGDDARAGRGVGRARDRGEREQRRDVADGVAPRGVDERRRDDDVGGRLVRLGGDQDRARAVRGGRAHARRASRPCRASWETRDADAAVLRVQRRLERVAGDRAGEQRRAGHRRVLARAAADDHDRPALADRLGRLERGGRGQDRLDQPRLGVDHLLHRPRRARAQLRHLAHGRRRYRLSGPPEQSHFDASEPCHFGALRRPGPLAPEPLRAQLEDAICAAITDGGAPPGTRLPASRVLAEALHVSRGVVSEAYAQIAAEGWIEVRHGAAPVVRAVPANVKRDSPALDSGARLRMPGVRATGANGAVPLVRRRGWT